MQRDPRHYKDFEFNLRELAGSMGDFGTLFPLALALFTAGLSVTTNMAIGFAAGLALNWLITWRWPELLAESEPRSS